MIQKTINDYYEQLFAEFPDIPKKDIKRILQFGYKSLYLTNSYGCDVVVQRGNFRMFFGRLCKDALKHFIYYQKKLKNKLRVLYKRNKTVWDGYYYFSLSKQGYEDYKAQINKRGRKRKKFTFHNVILRKLYEECLAVDTWGVVIFRVPMLSDLGITINFPEFVSEKAEIVTERDHVKMKDIMPYYNEYKIIKNKKYKK